MTTIDTHAGANSSGSVAGSGGAAATLLAVADWLTSTDHKKIGRLFIILASAGALLSVVIGVLLGFERMDSDSFQLFADDNIGQFFTFFRVELVFGAVLPMLIGIAIAVVPIQVGARSIAFARGASFGLWSWLAGIVMVEIAYLGNGGPGGGNETMVDLFLLGMLLLIVGLVFAAVSLVVTVLNSRAPGMTLERAPLFAWGALVGGSALVFTLPALGANLIYNFVDHRNGRVAFGGNFGVVDWIGWSLSQPQTYVFVLLALAMLAEIATVVSGARHMLRGVVLAGIGIAATSVLGGVIQQQQTMGWDGSFSDKLRDFVPWAIFNLLPILGAMTVLGASMFLLVTRRPRIIAPFVPALLSVVAVIVGMHGHALSTISSTNVATTVFEEAEFIFVMYGGLIAVMAGVSYWGPKLWGRLMPTSAVMGTGVLAFLGTFLAGLPYFVAGFADQPAGVANGFSYDGPQEAWNLLSTAGHVIVLVAVLGFVAAALTGFRNGSAAGDDPWNAHTLEWATPSPAPADNFAEVAVVKSAEPLLDLKTGGAS